MIARKIIAAWLLVISCSALSQSFQLNFSRDFLKEKIVKPVTEPFQQRFELETGVVEEKPAISGVSELSFITATDSLKFSLDVKVASKFQSVTRIYENDKPFDIHGEIVAEVESKSAFSLSKQGLVLADPKAVLSDLRHNYRVVPGEVGPPLSANTHGHIKSRIKRKATTVSKHALFDAEISSELQFREQFHDSMLGTIYTLIQNSTNVLNLPVNLSTEPNRMKIAIGSTTAAALKEDSQLLTTWSFIELLANKTWGGRMVSTQSLRSSLSLLRNEDPKESTDKALFSFEDKAIEINFENNKLLVSLNLKRVEAEDRHFEAPMTINIAYNFDESNSIVLTRKGMPNIEVSPNYSGRIGRRQKILLEEISESLGTSFPETINKMDLTPEGFTSKNFTMNKEGLDASWNKL